MYTSGEGAWTEAKAAGVGVERDPSTLTGHRWRGSYFDGEMARRASNLALNTRHEGDELVVTANVANVGGAQMMPGGPAFRQMLLLIDATDANGNALTPLDAPRADPADAANANRIIDVGGGYRKSGFFKLWEIEHGAPFPQMPYAGHVGKVCNGSWVMPAFMPMEWMFKYLWIGLIGWSPWNAMLGRSTADEQNTKTRFFGANLGTGDRLLRAAGGLILISLVFWGPKTAWAVIGTVPFLTAIVGWCLPCRFAGVSTCAADGGQGLWKPAWVNLSDRQRRNRLLAGTMMIFVAAVVPRAFAMNLWPVRGFAAERVLYDTRISHGESDTTVYRFAAPQGDAKKPARLVYCRHWHFMEPIKGEEYWSTDKWKYLLHEVTLDLPADTDEAIFVDAGNRDGSLQDMPPVPSVPGAGAMAQQVALTTPTQAGGE